MPRSDLENKLKFLKGISSRIKEEFEYDNNEVIVFYAESILEKIQEIEEALLDQNHLTIIMKLRRLVMHSMTQEHLNNQLFVAVVTSHFEAAKRAIDDGANVNSGEPNHTIFQVAVRLGETKIIDLLKQHGGIE